MGRSLLFLLGIFCFCVATVNSQRNVGGGRRVFTRRPTTTTPAPTTAPAPTPDSSATGRRNQAQAGAVERRRKSGMRGATETRGGGSPRIELVPPPVRSDRGQPPADPSKTAYTAQGSFPIIDGTVEVLGQLFVICVGALWPAEQYICCNDILMAKSEPLPAACCGSDYYYLDTEICCEGNYYPKHELGYATACCGDVYSLPEVETCCERDFRSKEQWGCCNEKWLYKPASVCCDYIAYAKTPSFSCCGPFYHSPDYACCGQVPFSKLFHSCCGSSTTYQQLTHQCCPNGRVLKVTELCNGVPLPIAPVIGSHGYS